MTDHDFKVEQSLYFDSMMKFIEEYRKNKMLDEKDAFLKSLFTKENV